jgi:hypothetical protein
MRQTAIVIATTAVITAIISIWTTSLIVTHIGARSDAALAASAVDLTQMIEDAKRLADENAAPVD